MCKFFCTHQNITIIDYNCIMNINISNRIKKNYSNKLFNQLCLIYLLIESNNKAYNYVISKKINCSYRSLNRYFCELYLCGIIPKTKINKKTLYPYYCIENIDENDENELDVYITNYIKHHKDLIQNQHSKRLIRLTKLMIDNLYSFYVVDEDEEYEYSKYTFDRPTKKDSKIYDFILFNIDDSLYKGISTKSLQRDVRLVKDVIVHMYEY